MCKSEREKEENFRPMSIGQNARSRDRATSFSLDQSIVYDGLQKGKPRTQKMGKKFRFIT